MSFKEFALSTASVKNRPQRDSSEVPVPLLCSMGAGDAASNEEMIMPGIDFDGVRREITMQQVLDEIGFRVTHQEGDQLRGPCPVHGSTSKNGRVFSVNLSAQRYYCHKCKSHGNHLELYAAVHQTTLYQAAVDLCHAMGQDVPWIRRW